MERDLGTLIRDLGDDEGRPLPATPEEMLARGERLHRRRRGAVVAGGAALCAALVLAVPAFGLLERQPVVTAAPASLQDIARSVPMAEQPQGKYWKMQFEVMSAEAPAPEQVVFWISDDKQYMQAQSGGPQEYGSSSGFHTWAEGSMSRAELAALPSEPGALKVALQQEIRQSQPKGTEGTGWQPPTERSLAPLIGQFLMHPVKPAVRQSLLRLLADAPGATVTGPVTDGAARPGLEVRFAERRMDFTSIVLGPNGTVLEYRMHHQDPSGSGAFSATEFDGVTVLSQSWVDELK